MKGVIITAGKGTRVQHLTHGKPKATLEIQGYPLIFYGLAKLKEAGITSICIVVSSEGKPHIEEMVQDGKKFGLEIGYAVHADRNGLAKAIGCARDFIGKDKFVVMIEDNMFSDPICGPVRAFEEMPEGNIMLVLKRVIDTSTVGIAEINTGGEIVSIEEKPKVPRSNLAIIGVYMYDYTVWDKIDSLTVPDMRGEFNVSELNKLYLSSRSIFSIEIGGWWLDVGTQEGWEKGCQLVLDCSLHKRLLERQFPALVTGKLLKENPIPLALQMRQPECTAPLP